MTPVSIVIPTWNGRRLLEEFLPSVIDAAGDYAARAAAAVEIVVVDDGSSDDTREWLARQREDGPVPIRVVRHDTNLGFGAACNRGVREAAHDLVLLINNDVALGRGAIGPLVARFETWSGPGRLFAVHCRVVDLSTAQEVGTGKMGGFSRGFLRVHRSYRARGAPAGPLYSMFASGGSAMFDRSIFLGIGGFDPLFAPFYFEDVELSYRAWKRGFVVCYEPESEIGHRFSSTIGRMAAGRVARISQRNRLIVHWIHLHDGRLLLRHALWVIVLLLAAVPTLRVHFIGAFIDAAERLPAIRARRREERQLARRTDGQVLGVFKTMSVRGDVQAYDDRRELEEA